MSDYQVIARKYRPQRFADVVGQEHVLRTLQNAIISGRTAHAYLFVGSRGIGKTTLSRIFAKAMNCQNPQNGEPCCQCPSCQAIAENRSLDIIEIDAASRNTVGEMRILTEEVLTRPVGGKYKIYIIDEVHMLSNAAWNVLLKTVEEPPAHVKFIFATTEVHKVLPTIISRCQRFDLQPIPTRLIAERLKLICDTEKIAIEPDALLAIARSAEGGMRDAQSLLDQMIAFFADDRGKVISAAEVWSLFGLTDRRDLEKLLFALIGNDASTVVRQINEQSRRGKNLETLFESLLEALRAVELCQILRDPAELIDETAEMIERYRQIAARAPAETIRILLEMLTPAGRILREALNKQIYLETILLKAMHEAHAVKLSDILARLNQLRAAGELNFLDQIPGKMPQRDLPELPPLPEAPAPVKTAPEPVKVAPAPIPETPVEILEPEPSATVEEPTVPFTPEAVITAAENPPPPAYEAAAESVDEESAEAAAIDPADTGAPAEPLAPPEHRRRESILHLDPQALDKAMKNPEVAEIADLFDARAIDVHQVVDK